MENRDAQPTSQAWGPEVDTLRLDKELDKDSGSRV